ncbi:MAG: helix-turn-helix transcriptional regulator [Bacteroidota bacterium]|nr:helix-turn-helix transcriptional regulator [Bacteroidota bacterium]
MSNTIEIRILQVFTESGLSRQEFSSKINISNAVLSHLSSGRNKASLDLATSILNEFKEINPEWLVLGIGDMKRDNKELRIDKIKSKLLDEIIKIKEDYSKNILQLEKLLNEIKDLK